MPYLDRGSKKDRKRLTAEGHVQVDDAVPSHLRNTIKVLTLDEIFVQTPITVEKRGVVHRTEGVFVDATFFVDLTCGSLLKASPPRFGDNRPVGPFYQRHFTHDFDGLELEKCGRGDIIGVRVRRGRIVLLGNGNKGGLEDVRFSLRIHVGVDVVGGGKGRRGCVETRAARDGGRRGGVF